MADRTMKELLQAPTEGYGEAIVILKILAENFKIKTNFLQLVQAKKFHDFERDNPHTHISNFRRMTATLKYRDVLNDAIKLMLFSYSLEGAARIWYEKEPPNSILTWDDLVHQFFPLSKTTHLKNEISRFTQRFKETFGEAWDRFKEILKACPHHGFSELTQIDTEALKIIENKSKVRYSRSKSNVSRVNTNSRDVVSKTDDRIDKLADQISNLVEIVNKQVIAPAKTIEKTCVTCGGAHAYYDFIATDSNSSSVCAATGSYNQVSPPNRASHQISPPGFASVQNNPNRFNQNQGQGNYFNQANNFSQGNDFRGNNFQNNQGYRAQMNNAPNFQNQVQPPVVHISIPKPDVLRTQSKPIILSPSSFTDALLLMPKFASTIKSLLANKDKLFELAKVPLNENCLAMLFKKLREKLGDPGRSFLRTDRALIDIYGEEITLRVNDESITFNLNQTMRYSSTYDDTFVNRVDVIDIACEDFVHDILNFQYNPKSSSPTLVFDASVFEKEPIVKFSSPTLTPFGESKFFLEEIEDFLNDDSIPTRIENSVYDPKGDILFLEKLLNEDPFQLPPMDLKLAEESKGKSFVEEPPELLILSHKISKSGIEVDRAKVDVIVKLPHLTTVMGVRSFLGHAGFYRRFIQDFSKIARPMTHLLEKETPFVFFKECIDAFNTLKKKLIEAPILVVPDWNLPFELMCDASDYAIGAVLGQRKSKHFQPIYYASKIMTEAQIHYTTTEKEMLIVLLKSSKLAMRDILGATMVPISQRRREKYLREMRCLRTISKFVRYSIFGVLLFNSRLKIFSGKLKTRWSGPFTITRVFPYGTIELSQPNGPNLNVNGHCVKHYFSGDIPFNVALDLYRVLVTKPHNKTPYDLLLSRTPSIGFMRPFGCPVTILNTLDPLGKFDGKNDEGFLVKYSVNSNAFRVFNRNQLNHSAGIKENVDADADVAFDVKENETEVHVSPSSSDKPNKHDEKAKREAKGKSLVDLSTRVRDLRDEFEEFFVNSTNRVNAANAPVTAVRPNPTNITNSFNAASPSDNAVNMPALEDIVYSDYKEDVGVEADFSNLETNIYVSPIPTTKVHKDHPVTQTIGELTLDPQTRSMAKMGYTQEEDIDYKEVFALVARIEAIWLFLAYASFMGFMVYQMDVKSAFLYGTIKEEVYVCQPLRFKDPDYPDKVYKVVKALYGLHQAPRAWYETLANYLLENELCKAFEKLMKDKFQMSSMGELTFFLGLQVKQKDDGIFISQDKYVVEILRKFGLTDGKSASTPIDTENPLLKDPDGEDMDVHTYRSMIGSLMYLTSSRPDIMFDVCACARFQVTLKVSHLHAVKRIFSCCKLLCSSTMDSKLVAGLWYQVDEKDGIGVTAGDLKLLLS
nr:putative ribonuclease H-like domain-containing protein [Tanacetum cinerariifolium]